MNKILILTAVTATTIGLNSCNLIEPNEVENPNITEETFLRGSNSMDTWVNGAEKTFALTVGTFCLHTEIISDNYYNNYTRESKVFDKPEINNNDQDAASMERGISKMCEAANFGLNKVQKYDKQTMEEHLSKLYLIKSYAFLLAGENFMALPVEQGGKVKTWKEQLNLALNTLDECSKYAKTDSAQALVHTLKARAYYRLGNADKAITESEAALSLSSKLLSAVKFDAANGVTNSIQDDIWKTMYQPLPRLDFLDPKYYQLTSMDECPISIAKAEENHLIIAEALLSKNNVSGCKTQLHKLLQLVKQRPVMKGLRDWNDNRFNGGFVHYPDSNGYTVAASPGEEYRSGLVLSRKKPNLINVPKVSGTSVTAEMIDKCSDNDALLELIYLMRQEIFIAEGRRMSDLGIRLPINEVEANNTDSAKPYTKALIPSFIPLEQGMDKFDIDKINHKVTIHYNMNKIIVKNKKSEYVVPFWK